MVRSPYSLWLAGCPSNRQESQPKPGAKLEAPTFSATTRRRAPPHRCGPGSAPIQHAWVFSVVGDVGNKPTPQLLLRACHAERSAEPWPRRVGIQSHSPSGCWYWGDGGTFVIEFGSVVLCCTSLIGGITKTSSSLPNASLSWVKTLLFCPRDTYPVCILHVSCMYMYPACLLLTCIRYVSLDAKPSVANVVGNIKNN